MAKAKEFTKAEACKMAKISPNTLDNYIRKGLIIPAFPSGGKNRADKLSSANIRELKAVIRVMNKTGLPGATIALYCNKYREDPKQLSDAFNRLITVADNVHKGLI
uniref:Putative DNA binding, helix-turn-helix domain containing protein n=1 Tax=viral metagenome TaxID=1070528 RepID=A0A6H1ZQN0_9ZZZZ